MYSYNMLTLKSNNHLRTSFKKFVLTQYWMTNNLRQMKQMLKDQVSLTYLSKYLDEKQTVPHIFKFLILIHRIVIEQTPYPQLLLSIISKLKWFSKGDFEEAISDKLIKPFQLFLQKRITFQFHCQALAQSIPGQKYLQTFKLINLLHSGTSFVGMIYTLGRYYRKDWITEFNIGLCMDLRKIYDILAKNIVLPPSKQLLEDIQILHQKLYQAFYNCYFHKYLKPFVPKWIKTDVQFQSPKKRSKSDLKTSSLSTCSSKNNSNSSSQKRKYMNSSSINLESSSCFLFNTRFQVSQFNNNQIDESLFQQGFDENLKTIQERFQLIKDMEKIVSMINQ